LPNVSRARDKSGCEGHAPLLLENPQIVVQIIVQRFGGCDGAGVLSELRNNLASYMDEVCDSRDVLHVTRQNARGVVMISEQEYEGLMETLHLLKSPANAERLLRGVADADSGKTAEHVLIETGTAALAK
jgi:antitoxin YefM